MGNSQELIKLIQDSQSKEDIIENLKSSECFKFLSSGNDRVISKVKEEKDWVYKIERYPQQNRKEFNLYNDIEGLPDRSLLPINEREENYRWIKCPLAKFNVSEDQKLKLLNRLIKDFGILPKDFNSDDIGFVNGRPVIADYGYGFRSFENPIDSIENLRRA